MGLRLFRALVVLAIFVTISNAGIISSSGLQRTYTWQTCVFQWTLDEPIVTYNVYNQTTGSQTPLSSNGNYAYNKANGTITLTIVNVQLKDAGNYSLLVTTAKSTYIDSTACLFVYVYLQAWLPSGLQATEGDTVELTCNLSSASLPAAYRSNIYYAWYMPKYGQFQNISSGQAMQWNGIVVPGYNIKNNGRTLVVSSVRYPDDQSIYCYGQEDGSNFGWNSFYYSLTLRYKPYASSFIPASKKFNAIPGSQVVLSFITQANPPITSMTNWTFVNSAGVPQELPSGSIEDYVSNNLYNPRLRFNFTSTAFYGNYSVTSTNPIGSTTTTFQVLPQGPPDAPSNLVLFYVSHYTVAVQWNLMWSNLITPQQTVSVRLRLSDSDVEIQTQNTSFYYENFNAVSTTTFSYNIQSNTNYKVSVWSANSLGSSNVVEMPTPIRTRNQPTLIVSPETILINGTQAIINFDFVLGENSENVTLVNAQCCSEFSALCTSSSVKYTSKQIVVMNIPNGTVYYIDVTIYSGIYGYYNYYSDTVRGIRVSRTGNQGPKTTDGKDKDSSDHLLVGVIVLAVLLGVAVLALIAILIAYLVKRSRHGRQPTKPPPIPADTSLNMTTRTTTERPQSNASNIYEPVDRDSSYDQHYYTGVK